MSTAQKGKPKGKGRIPWNKGKPWSEDVKKKLRISHLGHKHSEETKQKNVHIPKKKV